MPRSGSIDIPHVSVHDHYIRKPMKKSEVDKVKEFIGLHAINEKNPSNYIKAKAYIQQYDKFEYNIAYLDSANVYLSDKTSDELKKNFELLVHLNFIKQDYQQILRYVNRLGKDNVLKAMLTKRSWDNSNAWTLYRIGEAYYGAGDLENAYLCYKKADELSPYNPEFKNKIGGVLMAKNNVAEAIVMFESILKEDPKFVQALNNLGYANLISGNAAIAEDLYNKALKLDPDYESLLMNVAGLYIYKKNYKEAEVMLKKVLKKNPKNIQAQQVLSQLKTLK